MNRARSLLALVVALFAVSAAPARAAPGEDVVRLGNLKFAHYGAVSYMKELGPKYGLRIEERVFAKGIDIIPGMMAGDIDLAASAADGAVSARAAGVPIVVVAGFAKGGVRIVGRSDQPLKGVAGLKGKKVGVARGGAQEIVLLAELAQHKLTWSAKPGKDVQIVYLAYADLNQALQARNIDAMCQSEPQSSQAIAAGFGVEIVKPYDTPLGMPVRTLVMTEKLYKEKPDVAARVLRCFVEATNTFLRHPDVAEKYVREKVFKGQLTSKDYLDAIGNAPFTTEVTPEHLQVTAELMKQYGVGKLAQVPDAKEYVRTDLLQRAVSGAKESAPAGAKEAGSGK